MISFMAFMFYVVFVMFWRLHANPKSRFDRWLFSIDEYGEETNELEPLFFITLIIMSALMVGELCF